MEEFDTKCDYLKNNLFNGLNNLNNNGKFDSIDIYYFNESEFRIILGKVKKLKLGIFGIEPWMNNKYYDVQVYEEFTDDPRDIDWCYKVINNYNASNLQYSASYYVPMEILKQYKYSIQ